MLVVFWESHWSAKVKMRRRRRESVDRDAIVVWGSERERERGRGLNCEGYRVEFEMAVLYQAYVYLHDRKEGRKALLGW